VQQQNIGSAKPAERKFAILLVGMREKTISVLKA